jgi:hypothetical protein
LSKQFGRLHFLKCARPKIVQDKWTICDPDKPVYLQTEALERPTDLSVFSLA